MRQGPTALETLKQLVKFIGEYRPMLGSPVWLLRKCHNELGLSMRALVRSYMLAIEDLPKFLTWHVWSLVRLMLEEPCRRVVSRCFQNQRQSAAFVSLFKSLQSIELAQTGNPHERMFLHCGTLELTTMVVRMCQGENGIEILTSYDAAFASRLRYELASLRSEPAPDQIDKLSREEAQMIEEANHCEWKDEAADAMGFRKTAEPWDLIAEYEVPTQYTGHRGQ